MIEKKSNMADNVALKVLGVFDIIIGIAVFGLQVAFYALGYIGGPVYISSGFWGGAFFFVTGSMIVCKSSRNGIISMATLSVCAAFFMIVLFVWAISAFDDGYCYSLCSGYAIEIALLVSSIVATILNGLIVGKARKLSAPSITSPARFAPPPAYRPSDSVAIGAHQPYAMSGNVVYYAQNPNGTFQQVVFLPNPAIDSTNINSNHYQVPPPAYQSNVELPSTPPPYSNNESNAANSSK